MAISSFGAAAAGAAQQYEQIFASSGTWTKPTGVKTVELTCIGGGGGGYTSQVGGGAGGYFKGILDISGATSATITVGAGGLGSATPSATAGGRSTVSFDDGKTIAANGGSISGYQGDCVNPLIFGSGDITAGVQAASATGYGYSNSASLLAYGGGKYVALPRALGGLNYATSYAYYSTNGTSWTLGKTFSSARLYKDVAYGNGIFIALATLTNNGANLVSISSDGIDWKDYTLSVPCTGLTFANGVFVSSGANASGVGTAYWSTDGLIWNEGVVSRSVNVNDVASWQSRAMWNGSKFVVSTSSSAQWGTMYSSIDGKNWTQYIATGATLSSNFRSFIWSEAAYVGGVFIMGGPQALSYCWVSTDGIEWRASGTLTASMWINGISGNSGIILLSGVSSNTVGTYVAYSVDKGASWIDLPLRSTGGGVTSATSSLGYSSSIILTADNAKAILSFDGKYGGSGQNSSGISAITGSLAIKKGRPAIGGTGSAGPGEGSQAQGYHGTYNPNPLPGLPSADGYCAGGSNTGNGNLIASRYGDGGTASPNSINPNGFQGAVILRWWA